MKSDGTLSLLREHSNTERSDAVTRNGFSAVPQHDPAPRVVEDVNNPAVRVVEHVNNPIYSGQCGSFRLCILSIGAQRVPLVIEYTYPLVFLLPLAGCLLSFIFGAWLAVLFGPILFVSVFLHELGHAAMAVYLGKEVYQILIGPNNGLTSLPSLLLFTPRESALILIAGPLTHIPQALFWYAILGMCNGGVLHLEYLEWGDSFWVDICITAIIYQIYFLVFNLLPKYPLDGGQLLFMFLIWLEMDHNRALLVEGIASGLSGVFVALFIYFYVRDLPTFIILIIAISSCGDFLRVTFVCMYYGLRTEADQVPRYKQLALVKQARTTVAVHLEVQMAYRAAEEGTNGNDRASAVEANTYNPLH